MSTTRPASDVGPNPFLEIIVRLLLPHFMLGAADQHEARSQILQALGSYAARTGPELLQAAQVIALGMTTLEVLAEARTEEMSHSMRIRFRSCANGLNRSKLRTEQALDHRSANLPPEAIPPKFAASEIAPPEAVPPKAAPPEAAAPEAIHPKVAPPEALQADIAPPEVEGPRSDLMTAIHPPASPGPPPATTGRAGRKADLGPVKESNGAERNKQLWAGAMMQTLQQMGIHVRSDPAAFPSPAAATEARGQRPAEIH